MSALSQDPCYNDSLLTVDEAIEQMLSRATSSAESEEIDVIDALGRVLAEDICSIIDVPGHDNSAMDGYAVRCADCTESGASLQVTQRIPAGTIGEALEHGDAARIFTGAPVPSGADAVVMQEQCRVDGDSVIIDHVPEPGENIRRAGEDIAQGSVILQQGRRLRQQELGLIASVGIAQVRVVRKLRVACFFTGDEIIEPGEELAPGQIYNSNRYTLNGFLQHHDCVIEDYGIVADDLASTRSVLSQAAEESDLILTSGGVSVGEEDYVRLALEQLGEVDLWRIAMKPGKPVAFGRIGEALFLGLPGNPASVFVTAQIFALPVMKRLQCEADWSHVNIRVEAGFDWPAVKRQEYLRARLERVDGGFRAVIYPHQGSGVLSSASWATHLAVIPVDQEISQGDDVTVICLS